MFTGSCLCGGIAFSINAELGPIRICHCIQCQKAQGTAFAAVIVVDRQNFRLEAGEHLLKSFESSPGKFRHFCSRCGSPVFSARTDLSDVIRIRVGLLNEPLPVRIASHAYVASKCNWWTINDDAPQYQKSINEG